MDLVNLPPTPKIVDFPTSVAVSLAVLLTAILLAIVRYFDASGGTLTISLMVTLAFLGAVAFCMLFTIPSDEATSALIGGLTAAFGAVVAFWLGRKGPPNG